MVGQKSRIDILQLKLSNSSIMLLKTGDGSWPTLAYVSTSKYFDTLSCKLLCLCEKGMELVDLISTGEQPEQGVHTGAGKVMCSFKSKVSLGLCSVHSTG